MRKNYLIEELREHANTLISENMILDIYKNK